MIKPVTHSPHKVSRSSSNLKYECMYVKQVLIHTHVSGLVVNQGHGLQEEVMSKKGSVGVAQNYPQNYPAYTPGSKSYDEQLMSLGAESTLQNAPSYLRMDSTMSNGAAGKLMMTYNPNVPGTNLAKH